MHGSNDIRFGQELVRNAPSWSHRNLQGGVTVRRGGNSAQSADFTDIAVRGNVVQIRDAANDSCFLSGCFGPDFSVSCVKKLRDKENQRWVEQNIAVIEVPEACWASVFLQGMPL